MGQALYRRYRSKNLAEIVGQEHITRTLDNTLKRGAIGHAYLLTGPRGVGKTSIARILAHEINELPYETEQVHLDIIEIDAASNRRIDEIRDLRDKVHITPSSAKYKVYIIDEVHMLTKEAFNALLKTLEEPPKHVIFILATTDVHKLPETIISRTQHFTFKPIPALKIVDHLKTIAKQENIVIDDESLEVIAAHGGGSFRDSIGLLEQATGLADQVTADLVRQMLGVPPDNLIDQLVDTYKHGQVKKLVSLLDDLSVQGYQAEEISQQLNNVFREQLVAGKTDNPKQITDLLWALIDVPASREPKTRLELALLSSIVVESNNTEPANNAAEDRQAEPSPAKEDKRPATQTKEPPVVSKTDALKTAVVTESESKPARPGPALGSTVVNDEVWEAALQELKKSYSTLYSVARMAEFTTDGQNITLCFKFAFHKKRMESAKHKTILNDVLASVCKTKPILRFTLTADKSSSAAEQPKQNTEDNNPLEAISNIFGGAEVLES